MFHFFAIYPLKANFATFLLFSLFLGACIILFTESRYPGSSQFQDSELRISKKDLTHGDIINILAMPPYRPGERFCETYDVILILDERENFGFADLNLTMSILEYPLNVLLFNNIL